MLTFVDAVSDKAPAGARGHRVMLTRAAAEAGIPSLLGMALDYSPRLDGHDTRRKIGVITRAEIVGREITVGGFLYGRDFPEMVEEIGKNRAVGERARTAGDLASQSAPRNGQTRHADKYVRGTRHYAGGSPASTSGGPRSSSPAGLGMSYEIADAMVEDIKANIWVLNRVTFTGAAVLRQDKAAYKSTWIELV
ncbi:MAG: hypothetical protein WBL82_21105 [Terriglobales bacterium]